VTAPRAELEALAAIPSMGGHKIGDYLYRLAREHRGRGAVVEVGSWLGSSCAHLALGLRDAGSDAWIHCYDRFEANDLECEKAARAGCVLTPGQDIEPVFWRHVGAIYPRIRACKVDLREATWNGGPIEIYVDDAAKSWRLFRHVLATFGPSFVPGVTTLVLMDFNMYRSPAYEPAKRVRLRAQKRIMDALGRHFRPAYTNWPRSSTAAFHYVRPVDWSRLGRILGPDPERRPLRSAARRMLYRVARL
jgi:hypothetical protein